uniref:DNA repair protein XRCC1-like n=1 Tax=Myxine glutinosa TaxID=7769 RepID=UPI00358E0124
MPEIRLKHIVSCSSEDSVYRAENLLRADTFRKWQSAAGVTQAAVILQFEKAEKISQVDVGNAGSAFVEILVGNSSDDANNFQVLRATSALMSPAESRRGEEQNRVRMFGHDDLCKPILLSRWDRMKVVCSQPFKKTLPFGLSFLRVHSPSLENETNTEQPNSGVDPIANDLKPFGHLGAFSLRETETSAEELKPGSLFFNRHASTCSSLSHTVLSTAPTYAQSALLSSRLSLLTSTSPTKPTTNVISASQSPTCQRSVASTKRKFDFPHQPEISTVKRCSASPPSQEVSLQSGQLRVKDETQNDGSHRDSPERSASSNPQASGTDCRAPGADGRNERAFGKESANQHPLRGMVFCLSGFKNPFRQHLREHALALGASYRPDWSSACTHLVCAFAGSPKHLQQIASGHGVAVDKQWLLSCTAQSPLPDPTHFALASPRRAPTTHSARKAKD